MHMHAPALDPLQPPIVAMVHDDLLVREAIADDLHEVGYEVVDADGTPAAIDLANSADHVDLVFSDVRMPGELDGVGLVCLVCHPAEFRANE